MEDNNMELLKKIKRIDAPDHIYDQIVKQIEDRKIQSSGNLEQLFMQMDNNLYNE